MRCRGYQVVLAGAIMTALLLAACGGNAATPTPRPTVAAPTATTGAAAAPTATRPPAEPTATPRPTATTAPPTPTSPSVPSGSLTVALDAMGTFELVTTISTSKPYADALYDTLIAANFKGDLDPKAGFITSWILNADGTVWTFKNRDNVLFHNGDKASSSDIKFGLDRTVAVRSAAGVEIQREVQSIETPDPSTTVVTLKSRNIFWPTLRLSRLGPGSTLYHLVPKAYMEATGEGASQKKPVGSGPYKFASVSVGNEVAYEAVGNHWYYGVPRIAKLTFKNIPEQQTRVALLKTGGADIAPVSKKQARDIDKTKEAGLRVVFRGLTGVGSYVISAQWVESYPGSGKNPFSEVKVREAIDRYAIDRQAIVDSFLYGYGEPYIGIPDVLLDVSYVKKPITPYDPTKAKAMIADAGWPKGFEADFYIWATPGYPEAEDIMEAVATMLEKVGIKVNRIPIQFAAYGEKITRDNTWIRPTLGGSYYIAFRNGFGARAPTQHVAAGMYNASRDPVLDQAGKAWGAAKDMNEYVKLGQVYQQLAYDAVAPSSSGSGLFASGEVFVASSKVPPSWKMALGSASFGLELAGLNVPQ